MRIAVVAPLLLCLAGSSSAAPFTVVKNGKSDWKIVVAPGGSPSMEHGALELQRFILKISGAKLAILHPEAGWSEPTKHIIVLADDAILAQREKRKAMGPEEFRIKSRPAGILISGGAQRGVMYGCYALLEDVLGVRWYTPRITKVPKIRVLTLGDLNIHQKPGFEYREPFFTEAWDKDWSARNRVNGNTHYLDDSVGGKVTYGKFVHTFNDLVPPDKYFDEHPEYFSLVDGKRMKGYYQLCLTNPDVLRISIETVKQWIKENPKATIFSVSQNDVYHNCQCPACKAVEEEEGAASGVVLRFVNAVADAIVKDHPNVRIDTLAYQWTEKPPTKVRPRKNVRIRLAPIYACFSHPLDGCDENKTALANLKAWAKISDQLYVWHYTTNFANYMQPLPNLDEIAGDVPLFAKNHVVGLFDEGAYQPGGGGEMAELKSYLLAKLMWDPSRPAKPIIAEFLRGVYGKAAPQMQQWLDLIHAAGREGKVHARIYDPPNAPYFPSSLIAEGRTIFDAAEVAVDRDPVALDQVQRARLALEYVELMQMDPKAPEYAALAKRVATKVRRYGIGQAREGEPIEAFLQRIGQ